MIFEHTWQWLGVPSPHTGKLKTRTSRLQKPNQTWLTDKDHCTLANPITGVYNGDRAIWLLGRTYAVQPGRGLKQIGRVKILSIDEQDVRQITLEQAQAEGFKTIEDFLHVWADMYDKWTLKAWRKWSRKLSFRGFVASRPYQKYQAWILTFEFIPNAAYRFYEGWREVRTGKTYPLSELEEALNVE